MRKALAFLFTVLAAASVVKQRTYYLYVPKKVAASKKPAPLLVTLHGHGRDGRILVEHWQEYADQEGIILAGPDSMAVGGTGGITWDVPRDGPDFLRDVVDDVKTKQPVDTAARKIPLAEIIGTEDQVYSLAAVRAQRDALNQRGFNVRLTDTKLQ